MKEPTEIYVIADAGGNGEAETQASTVVGIVSDHDALTVFTSQEILRILVGSFHPSADALLLTVSVMPIPSLSP
jgi:hypothetical protein